MISLTRICPPCSLRHAATLLGGNPPHDVVGGTGDLVPVGELVVPRRVRRLPVLTRDALHHEARQPSVLRVRQPAGYTGHRRRRPTGDVDELLRDAGGRTP